MARVAREVDVNGGPYAELNWWYAIHPGNTQHVCVYTGEPDLKVEAAKIFKDAKVLKITKQDKTVIIKMEVE